MVTNIGNATPYIGGHGEVSVPTATDILYRRPHPERPPKPKGLDWNQHTPTCPRCSTKSGQIDASGLCPGCRGHVAAPAGSSTVTTARDSAYQTLDEHDLALHFGEPTQTPQDEATTGASLGRSSTPRPVAKPSPTVRAKVSLAGTHHVVIAMRSLTDPIDPVRVAALLNDLLTALQTPAPAGAATPPSAPAGAGTREARRDPVGKPTRRASTPTERARRRDKIHLPTPDVENAYTAGASIRDLAAKYDVSPPTIARHLDEHGIARRKQRVDYTPELIEAVRTRYLDHGMTQDQVAADLDVSLKVVQTAMTKGDIPARPGAHVAGLRPGADHAVALKGQLADLGVTSRAIKQWALEQGLVDRIARGVAPQRLVDAYTAAHPDAKEAS